MCKFFVYIPLILTITWETVTILQKEKLNSEW